MLKFDDNLITISVIIPAYNSSNTIIRCLESVVNQTIKVDEIVITNDGSTDDTLDKLKEFQILNYNFTIKIINQANRGIGAARNSSLINSKSNYVAFLDFQCIF